MEIEQEVKQIIKDHLVITPPVIELQSRIIDDLGADEIDLVEIVMIAEEKFNISISDREMNRLVTMQDLVNIIQSKKGDN
ncbi:MAG: acyl carrier protein [Rickettsiales bacterium]|nr:acyl carrier protein [Pseudomonadota bacterium]MDA0966851.1 acyl carrier protein [Pseudomonadota bacterium]MDG4543526.1 acyl carrier protein [Rickettsiales bacterium]MDG4545674.1 acyl carrier protein [Rickettsiales bacterium]MDG4547553.1 acyl carrier protein [Rickettsiales bacterium]